MTEISKTAKKALGLLMSPRMEVVFDCGDADHLRALLATWSEEELHKLHQDLHLAYDSAAWALDQEYRRALHENGFLPEVTTIWEECRMQLVAVFTEIHEELRFYLDKKPKGAVQ